MGWTFFLILMVIWVIGMLTGIGGNLIHAVLVAAITVIAFELGISIIKRLR